MPFFKDARLDLGMATRARKIALYLRSSSTALSGSTSPVFR